MEENKKVNKKSKNKKKNSKMPLYIFIAVILVIAIVLLLVKGCSSNKAPTNTDTTPVQTNTPLEIDETQGDHVDELVQYERNITLPGWGALHLDADTTTVKTIEFPNPEQNEWSEANFYIDDEFYCNILIGDETYYSLAAIIQSESKDEDLKVASVDSYDKDIFELDSEFGIRVKKSFEGEKTIVLTDDLGKKHTITVKSVDKCYYMTFALYLGSSDTDSELLYQSKLVSPGKSLTTLELTHSLPAGTYDGYVMIQPYYEDRATPTNSGMVKVQIVVE